MTRMSRLVSLSRESELTDYDADEALADESIHTDVVTEVEMPAQEISDASDDIEEAVDESESLQNTADMLNETVEDGGQGVDPVAAELVQEKVEAAIERYQLSIHTRRFSKESFNTVSSRREVTRRLAREAEETSKGIWQRVKDGLKAALEWIKNFFSNWFTKLGRLHSKVKALKSKFSSSDVSTNPENVKVPATRLGGIDLSKEVDKLSKINRSKIREIFSFVRFLDDRTIEVLKKKNFFEEAGGSLGGKKIFIEIKDSKFSATVESVEIGKEQEIHGVTVQEGKQILDKVDRALADYKAIDSEFKNFSREFAEAISKEYNVNTGKEKDIFDKEVLSVFTTINKVSSTTLASVMRIASVATEICSKSIGSATGDSEKSNDNFTEVTPIKNKSKSDAGYSSISPRLGQNKPKLLG